MHTQDLNILIVGGGRVGLRTAQTLDNRGHDITIIERDADRSSDAADRYIATVIEGDATRPSILQQANLDAIDVIAALTADLGTNLSVCLTAERYGSPIRTIMRRTDTDDDNEYADLVDTTVFPERAGARVTDISLPTESLVVSGTDGNSIAGAETTLEPESSYVIATETAVEDEIIQLFRG